MVGVYSFGRGLFEKEVVTGINTSYNNFYQLKSDHIVMSQLFGWEGAIALSSDHFEGKFLSSQFPTFLVHEEKADRRFIGFYLQQGSVWKELFTKGRGMGSRRRTLNPANLLSLEVPFPPLLEQQRIVSKIESIKHRIEQIGKLRLEQEKEFQQLSFSIFTNAENTFSKRNFGSFLILSDNIEEPEVNKNYRQVGIRWWGGGAYERETIDGSQTSYKAFVRLEKNNFLFNKIWVRNGALAIVKDETVGCYASGEFPVYCYDESEISPNWIDFIVNLPIFWQRCFNLSQGTSGKNRIKPNEFLKMEIPVPPIAEQNQIVPLLDKLNTLKIVRTQTEKELTQLLPSLLDKVFNGKL
ncbi:MAG: restriction endonuclease subunit S [Ignavibacteriaceae bacterium]|nr:restriction endonuclease subunit S [Ignavibacteriaceae bacterium]